MRLSLNAVMQADCRSEHFCSAQNEQYLSTEITGNGCEASQSDGAHRERVER